MNNKKNLSRKEAQNSVSVLVRENPWQLWRSRADVVDAAIAQQFIESDEIRVEHRVESLPNARELRMQERLHFALLIRRTKIRIAELAGKITDLAHEFWR